LTLSQRGPIGLDRDPLGLCEATDEGKERRRAEADGHVIVRAGRVGLAPEIVTCRRRGDPHMRLNRSAVS